MGIISLLLFLVFMFLGGLHFYWVFFGIKNPTAVLPTDVSGNLLMKPGKAGTVFVGVTLFLFAVIYLNKMVAYLALNGSTYISLAIGSIFLLRTIGDFKYLGFFKKLKSTRFAKMDGKYYSPLALVVSILIFILEFWG